MASGDHQPQRPVLVGQNAHLTQSEGSVKVKHGWRRSPAATISSSSTNLTSEPKCAFCQGKAWPAAASSRDQQPRPPVLPGKNAHFEQSVHSVIQKWGQFQLWLYLGLQAFAKGQSLGQYEYVHIEEVPYFERSHCIETVLS